MARSLFHLPHLCDLPPAPAAAVPPLLTATSQIQRLCTATSHPTFTSSIVSPCQNSDHTPTTPIGAWVPNQTLPLPLVVRRKLLLNAFSVAAAFSLTPISVALADIDDFRFYSDEVNKFKITIPQDWQVGNGEGDGVRALTAFYPQESSDSNVTVVITGLGADYTRLESFGKVDAFAETLVGGLDRSWQRPPGVAAKLVDCKAANGLYYIEYTLQKPGESLRHLYSVLGIANNGWYNRLYTLTGQFVEEEAAKYGTKIEKAVDSFRLF